MEKLSDIFKSIKERVSNPFIFSFIISWLIFNWELTVAIVWLNDEQIKHEGYNSLLELIRAKEIFVLTPVWYALGYTFIIYASKIVASVLQFSSISLADTLNLKMFKNSSIPTSKFLKLRDEFKERTEYLEKIIKDESKTIESFREAETLRLKAETNLVTEQQQVVKLISENDALKSKVKEVFDVNILNGIWECTEVLNKMPTTNRLYFVSGEISVLDGNKRNHTFDAKYFYYNELTGRVFFIKKIRPELISSEVLERDKLRLVNDLTTNDFQTMTGEQDGLKITYIRKEYSTLNS